MSQPPPFLLPPEPPGSRIRALLGGAGRQRVAVALLALAALLVAGFVWVRATPRLTGPPASQGAAADPSPAAEDPSAQGGVASPGQALPRAAPDTSAGPGSAQLDVNAQSDPAGLDPQGTVHAIGTSGAPMGDFEVQGPVTCLRVDGNKAAIKYRFSQASGSAAPFQGGGVEVFVEDNGKPGHPGDANASTPPQIAGVFNANATQCDDPNTANYDTVTSGDYTVIDSVVGP
jgi:hypothetical protein